MILNKFLDKTIEAAKQSAVQMYGNDLTALKGILPDTTGDEDDESKEERPGRTGDKKQRGRRRKNGEAGRLLPATTKPSPGAGVSFERSEKKITEANQGGASPVESKLTAIRAYAARQTGSDPEAFHGREEPAGGTSSPAKPGNPAGSPGNRPLDFASKQVYSRKDLRGTGRSGTGVVGRKEMPGRDHEGADGKKKTRPGAGDPRPSGREADETGRVSGRHSQTDRSPAPGNKKNGLHRRLDRLESLMHLTLRSDDPGYAAHPAYHKLLRKGVPRRLISDWFHTVSEQGIHPREQQELFSSKLSNIICEAVTKAKGYSGGKMLFFMGRSGTGKTHLVMKLSHYFRSKGDQKIAVVSLEPPAGGKRPYYTILDPFCADHDLPYVRLRAGTAAGAVTEKWEQFDHILIDTPSVEFLEEDSLSQVMEIKRQLQSAYSSETHYVVNTAVNGVAFHDPMSAEVRADYLALTHIDKSDRWGQAVPLLAQADYSLRFISSGETIPGDLEIFHPERFAKKLLN